MNVQQWSDEVCETLGIEVGPDLKAILDTAREVAHTIERPAAPVTAFLVGYAAAMRGGSTADVAEVDALVRALAERAGESEG